MARSFPSACFISILLASALLAGCGGGSGDSGNSKTAPAVAAPGPSILDPGAPTATGNTATDGYNWFNYRRQQLGLSVLARSTQIDAAAQGHSNYQKINNTITHEQDPSKPGFTGVTLLDRLTATGYQFNRNGYAYGEVISSTTDTSGFHAADDLITAIYHRFVIFEPMFKEAGAGAATVAGGYTYFTTDFTANGLDQGLGRGKFINYPYANQLNIPTTFYSDYESPDPVPDKNINAVGFPISIHADLNSLVTVQSFTVQPRGGMPLSTRLLTHAIDTQTPTSAAAIIPLNVLAGATTYDVQFIGAVDGLQANRAWSFTTR